jgi:hypothetical protein
MIRIGSPSRILAIIQEEIRIAETSSSMLPAAQLADYKSAIRAIPDSQTGYWQTVATVINYQSLLNQLNGYAPDPTKVARPCPGLTTQGRMRSDGNLFIGGDYSNCVVDLDGQGFDGITFQNAVIAIAAVEPDCEA